MILILTRISNGRMSISVAHPNLGTYLIVSESTILCELSFTNRWDFMKAINQDPGSALHILVQFFSGPSVPLIKRYFGLIKKWSIENSLGEYGKVQVASTHSTATVGREIFQSSHRPFFREIIKRNARKRFTLWLHNCGLRWDRFPIFCCFLFIFYTLSCYTTRRWLLLLLYIFTNISDSLTIPFTDSSLSLFRKPIYNQLK